MHRRYEQQTSTASHDLTHRMAGSIGVRRVQEVHRETYEHKTKRERRVEFAIQPQRNIIRTISICGFPSSGKNSKVYFLICPAMVSAHSTSNAYRVFQKCGREKKTYSCCVFVSKVRGKGRRDCHSGGELGGLRALGRVTIHAYREKGNRWTRVSGCVVND